MEIYGHKLPDELYTLIRNRDKDDLPFISVESLRKLVPPEVEILGGFFGGMRFNSIEAIKRESLCTHLLDDDQIAGLYSIASSKIYNKPIIDLHILDVDNALFIAGNDDEEVVALDYRVDPLNPRVLGSFYPTDWILLADTFAEFADKIGL